MDILIPAIAALVLFSIYKRVKYGGRKMIDKELAKKKIKEDKAILLDVRTPGEYAAGNIKGSTLMPFHTIKTAAPAKIELDRPVIVYCETGARSMKAAKMLEILGYKEVYDLGSRMNW